MFKKMYENYGLPGCDAMYFGRYVPLFQINPLFPCSVEMCSVLKKEATCSSKPLTYRPKHSVLQANRTLQIYLCQSLQKCQFKPTDRQVISERPYYPELWRLYTTQNFVARLYMQICNHLTEREKAKGQRTRVRSCSEYSLKE